MKKIGCLILSVMMLGVLVTGCAQVESDSTMVYVGKKGQVQTIDVEVFDQSYYSESEFQTFAQEAINAYNQSHDADSIALNEFAVESGVAKLKMAYKTVEDYNEFNDILLYQGTVADAVGDGFLFDVTFSKVEDGEVTGTATRSDILAEDGLHVIIIGANTDVQIEGKILYVSEENVTVTAKNMVSICDDESTSLESDIYTYIIYK